MGGGGGGCGGLGFRSFGYRTSSSLQASKHRWSSKLQPGASLMHQLDASTCASDLINSKPWTLKGFRV